MNYRFNWKGDVNHTSGMATFFPGSVDEVTIPFNSFAEAFNLESAIQHQLTKSYNDGKRALRQLMLDTLA